jgi:hypothetical protein
VVLLKRSAMLAGNPLSLIITVQEEEGRPGCLVFFQQINAEGETTDHWEIGYERIEEALREIEMTYGVGPEDWTLLED